MKNDIRDFLLEDAKIVCNNFNIRVFSGKTILLTGASGILGINILSAIFYYNNFLVKDGSKNKIKVYAIYFSNSSKFVKDIFTSKDFKFIQGNISSIKFINKLPNCDIIIHSAGYAQPKKFLENSLETIQINSSSLIAISKKLKNRGKILFVSSAEVYSGSKNKHNSEIDIGSTNPLHERACYIEGKRIGETIINILRMKGVNAFSTRLALAYGPGINLTDKRLLNELMIRGIKNHKINLKDSGDAIRTYAYVSDVVLIFFNILSKGTEPVYNVGGVSRVTVAGLAKKISKLMNVKLIIPKRKAILLNAPKTVSLNLSKIKKEFNISSFIKIDEGLKRTYEWLKLLNQFNKNK